MHHTADVADLAVALTSVLRNTSDTQVSLAVGARRARRCAATSGSAR